MNVAERESFARGLREGVPFAVAGGLLSLSFGVLADEVGLGAPAAILMSTIVFAGSAQFAAVGILAAGGGPWTAVIAAALVNSRFLPMGVALAPDLPGRALWRAIQGQTVVDAVIALSLVPFAPAGIPVLAASLAALVGLRGRGASAEERA